MQQGLGYASNLFNNQSQMSLPGGDWAAQQNPLQSSANNNLWNYGALAGPEFTPYSQTGMSMSGAGPGYETNAQGLAQGGINGVNPSLSGMMQNYAMTGQMPGARGINPALGAGITGAAAGGYGSIGQGNAVANQVAAMSGNPQNAMNAALSGASQFSNNPTLNGQIDAVNTDVNRNLTENTLPQIQAAALASGNTNSSREGALEAISTQQAAQNMANNAATIRANAYNTGANLGEQGYLTGQNTALGGANALNYNGSVAGNLATGEQGLQQQQNQFGINSQLGAANSNLGLDLNSRLGGNAQLGNAYGLGMNGVNTGLNGELTGLNAAQGAGNAEQTQQQQQINAVLNQFQAGVQFPQQLLNNYWGVVGKPLGSQSSSSSNTMNNGSGGLMGGLQGALGGGLAANGLYQNLKNSGIFGNNGTTAPSQSGQPYNYNPFTNPGAITSNNGGGTYNFDFMPGAFGSGSGSTGGYGGYSGGGY
jgi:hypothetical protein